MKKKAFFFFIFSFVFSVFVSGAEPAAPPTFEVPAMESLTLERVPGKVLLKSADGKTQLVIYALNQAVTEKLNVRLEKDCVVMNTNGMEESEFGNIQVRSNILDHQTMGGHAYALCYTIQGPQGQTGNFYFEGHTLGGKHYYEAQKIRFNGRPQKLIFCKAIADDLKELGLRYDFFGKGEFRIYATKVVPMASLPEAKLEDKKAELIFSANFDGTADAQTAKGQKSPKRAENLKFTDDSVSGQALEFRENGHPLLEYLTTGNIRQEYGSISVWVKPDWNDPENKHTWRSIVSEPYPGNTRIGSGAIAGWIHEGRLRLDTSDMNDQYIQTPMQKGDAWVHVVFNWTPASKEIYMNGKRFGSISDDYQPQKPATPYLFSRLPMEVFCVGGLPGWQCLEGNLDELKIFSAPLTPEEIQGLYREFRPISLKRDGTLCVLAEKEVQISGSVQNQAKDDLEGTVKIFVDDQPEPVEELEAHFPASKVTPIHFNVKLNPQTTPKGQRIKSLRLHVFQKDRNGEILADSRIIPVLPVLHSEETLKAEEEKIRKESALKNLWTDELKLKLIEEIDPTTLPADRITSFGEKAVGELDGRKYLEMKNEKGFRFAIHLPAIQKGKLYCFEWEIPDDKMRTVDIIAQSAKLTAGTEYELQTGYCTGDEYPNTGKWIVQRDLLWSRADDYALVFTTNRTVTPVETKNPNCPNGECVGGGAAIGTIRIYEVLNPELPIARINPAHPVDGWTRPVGIYFEDPAINCDFGVNGSNLEDYPVMLANIVSYMKYSGQNMLAYPMVWYHGPIGDLYNPRSHVQCFFDGILSVFDREGLEFMGTFNQNNVTFPVPRITFDDVAPNGRLNASAYTIHSAGTIHPGGWHGSPPVFNTLHPDVQKMTLKQLDDILAFAAKHPSFKGIILHLPRHALHSLGDITAGYNDYLIDAFEKETGIKIEIDHKAPDRGRLAYEWLMKNAREDWIDWRCRKIADWYKTLAEHLRKARPDLKLGINCMRPIIYETSEYDDVQEMRDFWGLVNREMGIDAKYFADVPNMFIDQTLFPADYRWTENRKDEPSRARLRNTEETAGQYASLKPSRNAWIHHHDRYWESAIGTDEKVKLQADWLREHGWRVSTLNPTGFYAMKHYILPLKYQDILGFTKGGFLIGTYGMEKQLVKFAAAYRALPAVPFDDLKECCSEDVKVRTYSNGKYTWFYAVNASGKTQEVTIPMKTQKAVDLGANVQRPVKNGKLTVKLEPMSLRSFRIKNGKSK